MPPRIPAVPPHAGFAAPAMNTGGPATQTLEGEHVVWSGQPRQGLVFTGRDLFLVPFSLMWGGFAVFWEVSVLKIPAPAVFWLWGIPFVVIGLYLIAGRFIVDAWLRRRTRYVLTNRRILITRSAPFGSTTSLFLDRLPEVQLRERANGRGTLRFGPSTSYWGRDAAFGLWSPALDPTPQFIGIENARDVFDQIQRSIRNAA
jgi:hypothetical protein